MTNGKERKHIDQKWHKNVKQQESLKFGTFPQSCIIAQHCAKQCKKLEETTIGWDALWGGILILMKNYIRLHLVFSKNVVHCSDLLL